MSLLRLPMVFRRFLLPLFALTAAIASSAQTQVTFTLSGTMNGAPAEGYKTSDPITFTFVLNTASLPTGSLNSNLLTWASDSSHPLFTSVTGTGLTGTWNGTDGKGNLSTDEIIINTSFNSLTLQTSASSGNLLLQAPDTTHYATDIIVLAQWTGLSLPATSYADPVAYFAARAGTYNFSPGTANTMFSFDAGSANFLPSSLTISTSAIPEPATEAMLAGLGVLSLALLRRRRSA